MKWHNGNPLIKLAGPILVRTTEEKGGPKASMPAAAAAAAVQGKFCLAQYSHAGITFLTRGGVRTHR